MGNLSSPHQSGTQQLQTFLLGLRNLSNEELRSELRPLVSKAGFADDQIVIQLVQRENPAKVSLDGTYSTVKIRSATWASLVSNLHVDALLQLVMWYGQVFNLPDTISDRVNFIACCDVVRSHFMDVMADPSVNGVAGDGKTGYKLGKSCYYPSHPHDTKQWAIDLVEAEIKRREGKEPVGSDDGVTLEQIHDLVIDPNKPSKIVATRLDMPDTPLKPFSFNTAMEQALNDMFKHTTGETIDVKTMLNDLITRVNDAKLTEDEFKKQLSESTATIKSLRSRPAVALPTEVVSNDATIPNGKVKTIRAWEVFATEDLKNEVFVNGSPEPEGFEFDIPMMEWDAPHPNVPEIDPDHKFDLATMKPLLWALATGKNAYLYGHSGTGKTTDVHQVAARLGWPIFRVNMDSEMSRVDLIGRETLRQENGTTVSQFVEGVLPTAMQMGAIFEADEVDFGRSDVMYAFQSMLEEGGTLRLTEDGGRIVKPHPLFRVVATANTKGQGDETGCYQGARVQSAAFLDRFTVWIEKEYLKPKVEAKVIKAKVPDCGDKAISQLIKIAGEMRKAFVNGEIMTTVSPRGLITAAAMFTTLGDTKDNLQTAVRHCISGRCTDVDVLKVEEFIKAHII